jgi:hypothetical protein
MGQIPVFSKGRRLVWSCWLVVVVCCLVLLLVVMMIAGALGLAFTRQAFVLALAILMSCGFLVIVVESTFRCDHCNRRFMIEGSGSKHPRAHRRGTMNHWGSAVIDILRERTFTCMYCGQLFRIRA